MFKEMRNLLRFSMIFNSIRLFKKIVLKCFSSSILLEWFRLTMCTKMQEMIVHWTKSTQRNFLWTLLCLMKPCLFQILNLLIAVGKFYILWAPTTLTSFSNPDLKSRLHSLLNKMEVFNKEQTPWFNGVPKETS